MEILFLGTSAGVPTKDRNVSGLAVVESRSRHWYLVDCGEGTQHQILRTALSLNTLKGIFITHIHGDHCYGLMGVLASAGMNRRTAPLYIVGPKGIKHWIEATCQFTQLTMPYEIIFVESETFTPMQLGEFKVTSTALSHVVPSYAYAFEEATVASSLDQDKLLREGISKGPVWGKIQAGEDVEYDGRRIHSKDFLIQKHRPRKLVVGGDNDNPELLRPLCSGCDLLIHEATYTKAIWEKSGGAFGHSYAGLVGQFAQSMAIPNLILTHISSRYVLNSHASVSVRHLFDEAAALYQGHLWMAQDFQRYGIDKNGDVSFIVQR